MSIRNEDRHGLSNLRHEEVKPFDKYHIPPLLIFFMVMPVFYYIVKIINSDEQLRDQQQRNLLLAMRKTQKAIEYGEDEISSSEELTMASSQFQSVIQKQKSKEQKTLSDIKEKYLTDGMARKAKEKVDISNLINKQ